VKIFSYEETWLISPSISLEMDHRSGPEALYPPLFTQRKRVSHAIFH